MTKTFTCRELGGICDTSFSADTFNGIVEQGMRHIMGDGAHTAHVMSLEERTGENKEQWMARMQKEFDAKSEDA